MHSGITFYSSVQELRDLRPDMDKISELSSRYKIVGMHVFVFPDQDQDQDQAKLTVESFQVRNFAPLYGIDEESATGTSNCALACALWESGRLRSVAPGGLLSFHQGDGMGSPSRITVRLPEETGAAPWVGGSFAVRGHHVAVLPHVALAQ